MKQERTHYYWLDLLRFISAFLVVLCHYRDNFFVEYGLLPTEDKNIFTQLFFFITRLGNESVLVFFILSGFLVGGRALQRILNNDTDVKSYFIDRFTRIMLPLLASLLFVVIINLIISEPIPFKDIAGSLLSVQDVFTSRSFNPPLWSLAYEVWFYILIGCIMIICSGNNKRNILFSFFVLAICMYMFSKLETSYLLVLLMGTFAFLLPRENISNLKSKIAILIVLLFIAFALVQLTSGTRSLNLSFFDFLDRDASIIFLALTTSLLVHHIVVAKPQRKFWIKLESGSAIFSNFSYTLYLIHYPFIYLLSYFGFPESKQINFTSISYYLVACFSSLVVAYLVYLVAEKQTPVVKRFIKHRLSA